MPGTTNCNVTKDIRNEPNGVLPKPLLLIKKNCVFGFKIEGPNGTQKAVATINVLKKKIRNSKMILLLTAGSHYCCTAQDSLNGDQLTAHFEVHLEKHA